MVEPVGARWKKLASDRRVHAHRMLTTDTLSDSCSVEQYARTLATRSEVNMPALLGLEAEKNGFDFVVAGADENGEIHILDQASRIVPPNRSRADGLLWISREIDELITNYSPVSAYLKRAEGGRTTSKALLEHAQVDGVLLATGARRGLQIVELPLVTLARRLSCKSSASLQILLEARAAQLGVAKKRLRALGCALAAGVAER